MSGSAVSILYLVFLGILFILLVVMTVTLIVSKKKKDDDYDEEDEYFNDMEDDEEDYDEENEDDADNNQESETSYNVDEDSAFGDSAFGDSAFGDSAFGDSAFGDSAFGDSAFGDSAFGDSAFGDSAFTDIPSEQNVDEEQADEVDSLPQDTTQKLPQEEVKEEIKKQIREAKQAADVQKESEEDVQVTITEASVQKELEQQVAEPIAPMNPDMFTQPNVAQVQPAATMNPDMPAQSDDTHNMDPNMELQVDGSNEDITSDSAFGDSAFGNEIYEDSAFGDSAFSDSAFVESAIPVLSDEAIQASVREAEAMGAAVTGMTGSLVDVTAAIAEKEKAPTKKHGRTHKQPAQKQSAYKQSYNNITYANPSDDFFWFNKVDAAERPSYKTEEMYYHHFNLPKDCLEDLLMEMYDCGLVRTEEIRYIAYGIEPRAVSIKEILTSGNSSYVKQVKKKEPTTQDLVNIYEKWCGYVDKLFDIIEMHADEMTYNQIRHMLYEYGRNDVDELIEGK